MEENAWHHIKIEDALVRLASSPQGLTSEEVKRRIKEYGRNTLREVKPPHLFFIFLRQFKSVFVLILGAAFAVTLLLKEYTDAIVVAAALLLNALVGFFQEARAERTLASLKKLIRHDARVLRDGREIMVPSHEIVPGDMMVLESGDRIAADARLTEVYDLEIDEAALTGESLPIIKDIQPQPQNAILAERRSMVFAGTTVTSGRGRALVTATGVGTEMGKISRAVAQTKREPTPLETQIRQLARFLSVLILTASVFFFAAGIMAGKNFYDIFLTATALAVAAVPEGLLVSMTIVLAIGMERLVRERAVVRSLLAAETLGSVSVVCVDKTGTITEGQMRVAGIWTGRELTKEEHFARGAGERAQALFRMLQIGILCNDAVVQNPDASLEEWIPPLARGKGWKILADPTQKALLLAGLGAGLHLEEERARWLRFDEIPFNSRHKYAATAHHKSRTRDIIFFRGAPEKILEASDRIRVDGKAEPLDRAGKKKLFRTLERFASEGFRVVGAGYQEIPCDHRVLERGDGVFAQIVFAGFFLLRDPLRESIRETVAEARGAGVRTVMITGDHKNTALAIARDAGIDLKGGRALSGEEMEKMSVEEFERAAPGISVYARTSPAHKSRIVDALQKRGDVVAMTGDGVNDAPALKSADIGIAVGSGTDVAKETADVVLLDNNFKTIIRAIEGGRVIFENIRKVVVYLLSDNFQELAILGLSLFGGLPLPLLPAQILWINLAEDALPAAALAFEKGEPGLLDDPPRPRRSTILGRPHQRLVLSISGATTVLFFALFLFLQRVEPAIEYTRTIMFVGLSMSSLLYLYSCRSLRHTVWQSNPFSNHAVNFSVFFGVILLVAAVYVPGLQKVLDTVPLGARDWFFIAAASMVNLLCVEILKRVFVLGGRRA